jgi:hypothetical protein
MLGIFWKTLRNCKLWNSFITVDTTAKKSSNGKQSTESLHRKLTAQKIKMSDIASVVFDLIFKPGSSLTLIPIINAAVICLLGLLIFLSYTKIATIHLFVMGFLSIGLLISVNWYVVIKNNITINQLIYLVFVGFIMNSNV